MNAILKKKLNLLKKNISELGSVVVAFSGGTDSSLLLKISSEVLGGRVLAVTVASDFIKSGEVDSARCLAKIMGVRNKVVDCFLLADKKIRSNPRRRCYFCKKKLMQLLADVARRGGYAAVIEGSNADDSKQFRPGKKALVELSIRSPLAEAELTKKEIRCLARYYRLPNYDAPSSSCLATRFPYGTRLTAEKLLSVAALEQQLRHFGVKQVRVRMHENIARIEVAKTDLPRLLKVATSSFLSKIKKTGVSFVCADLEGFRSGSMDQV